jgi:hypothetical protein
MKKPTVFFSHSSKDQAALTKLKAKYLALTGGSVDVFLSSDGQSIPLGRNWVHKVEEGLEAAELMLAFITPASIKSGWLFFEAGYAYSKGLRVVPVGFAGTDLASVPPPLSLLQGFNVTSEAALNNIIAITNDVFKHAHREGFQRSDFEEICTQAGASTATIFGAYRPYVDQIRLFLGVDDFSGDPDAALDKLFKVFESRSLECRRNTNRLDLPGLSFVVQKDSLQPKQHMIYVNIEATAADIALGNVEIALREICTDGLERRALTIEFSQDVSFPTAVHQQSGRLMGSGVRLAPKDQFQFRDLEFCLNRRRSFVGNSVTMGNAFLGITLTKDQMPHDQIADLISLLFERQVLLPGIDE